MPLRRPHLHIAAATLLILSLGLLSWGLAAARPLAWQTGLGSLVVAMGMAFATRFVPDGQGGTEST